MSFRQLKNDFSQLYMSLRTLFSYKNGFWYIEWTKNYLIKFSIK